MKCAKLEIGHRTISGIERDDGTSCENSKDVVCQYRKANATSTSIPPCAQGS